MEGGETVPVAGSTAAFGKVADASRAILEAHWQPQGYTVPNAHVYPHQWLWDSCFHAIAWAHLGRDDRALAELGNVFAHQHDDGFVPHMTYWQAPHQHADFWGRRQTSSITQPPMYGHAVAVLWRLGIDVGRDLVERAAAGLEHLMRRRDERGSVVILHPWESGCDDSPRWDSWCEPVWNPVDWKRVKGELVASLRLDPGTGSPVGNDRFTVASSAFEALVAFNAAELADLVADPSTSARLRDHGADAGADVRTRWDDHLGTFLDGGSHASASARTLEALLPLLCEGRDDPDPVAAAVFGDEPARDTGDAGRVGVDATAALWDRRAWGGDFGPAQVHRDEPAFDAHQYWRGGTWPQLNYLLWVAANRLGREHAADRLRDLTVRGALRSGFAEYWDPDTGEGRGAVPQSWTTLVAVMIS